MQAAGFREYLVWLITTIHRRELQCINCPESEILIVANDY